MFSATAISNLGDGVAMVAYPWLATLISKDPLDIAFVAFASRLPWFLLALPAGVITDRAAHKKLMVGADIFRALLTLCVVALVFWMPSSGAILLLAAALMWRLRPRPTPAARQAPALAAMKEGMLWVWRYKIIFRLAMVTGFLNFTGTVALTILVLFAQDILGAGALGYGLIMSFGAVGGGLGGLLAPRIIGRIGEGWALRIAVVLFAMQMQIFGAATHAVWMGFALFLGTFGSLLWNVVAVPLRQRATPPELLGRVNSVYRFISWGLIPLGAILSGVMVKAIDRFSSYETALRAPYFVVGGLLFLAAFYVFFKVNPDAK